MTTITPQLKRVTLRFGTTLAAALALGLGLAFAQPSIAIGDLTMQAGTMAPYLTNSATGGTTGLCFQNSTGSGSTSYACFERALRVSGLGAMVNGSKAVTVFAPTDAAFAHLEDTVGVGAFQRFMASPTAMAAFVRRSIVNGTTTVNDLAYHAPIATAATSVTTVAGTPLAVSFGSVGYGTSSTTVDVGPSSAVDGQSFVIGTPVMFADGSVLIPLGRITLTSLGA
jgi:uncharacterized surface protein with fasciclin (FAS1) repeats